MTVEPTEIKYMLGITGKGVLACYILYPSKLAAREAAKSYVKDGYNVEVFERRLYDYLVDTKCFCEG